MPFEIVRNDITKVKADAIVNTANPQPVIGSGTDRAVYKAAGEKELLAERKKIGVIQPGEVHATKAFKLKAKYILHTVGPAWEDGNHGERETLHACYRNALLQANELKCKSIAFPLLATGNYGFPKDEALDIALKEIGQFLLTHDMQVTLVVFDRKAFVLSSELMADIEEFIDEDGARAIYDDEYAEDNRTPRMRDVYEAVKMMAPMPSEDFAEDFAEAATATAPKLAAKSLDDILEETEDTFQQRLLKLIDESGMTDVEVYKKANLDRKNFSKMRSNVNYKPSKKTALAYAIALGLDLDTTVDLLARAGLAFSPSSKFDRIIEHFLENQQYDIYTINATLFKCGQPTLG